MKLLLCLLLLTGSLPCVRSLTATFDNIFFKIAKNFFPKEAKEMLETYPFLARNKHSPEDIKNELCEINEARRKFAVERQFASMAEMYWDDSLAEKAKSIDCDVEAVAGDHRVFRFSNNVCSLIWNGETVSAVVEKGLSGVDPKSTLGLIELLLPGHNKIGCAPKRCNVEWKCAVSENFDFDYTCLLGSDAGHAESMQFGEPGSKCDAMKLVDNDGLCSKEDVESVPCSGHLATTSLAFIPILLVAVFY